MSDFDFDAFLASHEKSVADWEEYKKNNPFDWDYWEKKIADWEASENQDRELTEAD